MPIKVQNDLPAKKVLEKENIFVMDEKRALTQDIRPLKIAVLNLMPLKEDTEVMLMRSLSNTPLQIDLTFLTTASYVGHNTATSHLDTFYMTFEEVKNQKFDGMIITGAPVEQMPFEEVAYWDELKQIMAWSEKNVTSTLHICWGAQAGLYYHYGIPKIDLKKKLSGIYEHHVMNRKEPLVRGFDDVFKIPHSRYTESDNEAIRNDKRLMIMAESEEAGIFLCMDRKKRRIFVMGHPEYDRITLDKEYKRDLAKGIDPDIPKNYYPDNDPKKEPVLSWRGHANTLYTNWVNYYVYQVTPYEL
ncbi:MAG: homoserine O-succinyltransferase [Lachnospiraceae bacterium]|nr:homoserine O-succinyltransferase [Lachnospiraceae bacterium]